MRGVANLDHPHLDNEGGANPHHPHLVHEGVANPHLPPCMMPAYWTHVEVVEPSITAMYP